MGGTTAASNVEEEALAANMQDEVVDKDLDNLGRQRRS